METMLRRFAAGLWGTSWIGLQVCLAWFLLLVGGFELSWFFWIVVFLSVWVIYTTSA